MKPISCLVVKPLENGLPESDFSRPAGNTVNTNHASPEMYVDFLWNFQFLAKYWVPVKSLYMALTL